MKIIVFGPTGKVGQELMLRLKDHDVVGVPRRGADLSNPFSAGKLIENNKPDIVINAAAKNGMEVCDKDPLDAFMVNGVTQAVMANSCKKVGALFVTYSTDYVFSGNEYGLHEVTKTEPSGIYGWSKRKGEEAVATCGGDWLVLRLSSIYGRAYTGPLDPITQAANGKGTSANPVMVLQQFCAPTSARLVADATAHVINTVPREQWAEKTGLYHVATSEAVWKRDFAEAVLNRLLPRIEAWIVREGVLPVPRPVHTVLRADKFMETFGYELPSWKDDLEATIPILDELPQKLAAD